MSAVKAPVSVTKKIRENFDKTIEVCSVFLESPKAFDNVKHDILIQKLESYGLRGQYLKLKKNFLSERNQFVQIGQNFSNILKPHVGVAEGSVLGKFLFLV